MRNTLFLPALLGLLVLAPATQAAGLTGITVGAGIWKQEPSGYFQSEGDRADVEDELRIDSERSSFFWVDFRHRVPLLPRLKLQYTPVSMSGDGTVSSSFTFQGVTFTGSQSVRSELEADQIDAILYWTPWSRLVDVDLGVHVKYLDGYVFVENRDDGDSYRASFSGPLPLLYARTEIRLPGTGFYAGGEGSYVAYQGNNVLDATVRAGYRLRLGVVALGLEGGWKHQRIRFDDFDDLDADFTLEGPYAALSAHF